MFGLQHACARDEGGCLCNAGSAARPRRPRARARERSWRRSGRSCPRWCSRCRSSLRPSCPGQRPTQILVRTPPSMSLWHHPAELSHERQCSRIVARCIAAARADVRAGRAGTPGHQHGQSAFAAHAVHALPNGEPLEPSALSNGDTPSQPPHPASYMEVRIPCHLECQRARAYRACLVCLLPSLACCLYRAAAMPLAGRLTCS